MENSGKIAVATVQTPDGKISYEGDARIDGVPGTAAPVALEFRDTAGSTCGALLPSGHVVDRIQGVEVTLIDNGMPTVILRASDMGIDGSESRDELNGNEGLKARLEAIRLEAGEMMNLGDVVDKTIPKMTMVSAAKNGGAISTATFIPHICHASIGVFCAVSVATACSLAGTPVAALANVPGSAKKEMRIEHPSGETTILLNMDANGAVKSAEVLRTARKLFDGNIFAPGKDT
jgi:4-oxalomesaconate tautomerase